MKNIKLIFAFTLAYAMCSCGAKNPSANEAESVEKEIVSRDSGINPQDYSDLIKTVYANFVFAIDADSEVYAHPERYFTAIALKNSRIIMSSTAKIITAMPFMNLEDKSKILSLVQLENLLLPILRVSAIIGML